MKRVAYHFIALSAIVCACAQTSAPANPPWTARVTVLDEASQPLPGATVEVWYHVKPPPGQSEASEKIIGLTDNTGFFRATHPDTRSRLLTLSATKAGYYPSTIGYDLAFNYEPVSWNRSSTLVLKKLKRPAAMYAKRVRQGPPVLEKPVGYDLSTGDWVVPYGKGNNTDILFTAHLDKRAEKDWDYKLIVAFPKPGDGIQPFTISEIDKTSSLRSPQEAPPSGYQPEWVKTRSRRPGEPSTYGLDDNLSFFFRVRTILDEKGNVRSANYGKIYGDFMNFQYFLNPDPNSRDIEFDPNKNLLKQLAPDERVSIP